MHSNQHTDLNHKNDRVDSLKVVVIKQSGPENLEAAIEQGTARANHSQSLVIQATRESILFELIRHVIAVEHVTDDHAVKHAKFVGLKHVPQR